MWWLLQAFMVKYALMSFLLQFAYLNIFNILYI